MRLSHTQPTLRVKCSRSCIKIHVLTAAKADAEFLSSIVKFGRPEYEEMYRKNADCMQAGLVSDELAYLILSRESSKQMIESFDEPKKRLTWSPLGPWSFTPRMREVAIVLVLIAITINLVMLILSCYKYYEFSRLLTW